MGNLKWPEGKKCAVMFTFDVDGDTTWENGNRGLPNGEKYIKSLSVGQYGPKRCVDRILDMLERRFAAIRANSLRSNRLSVAAAILVSLRGLR